MQITIAKAVKFLLAHQLNLLHFVLSADIEHSLIPDIVDQEVEGLIGLRFNQDLV